MARKKGDKIINGKVVSLEEQLKMSSRTPVETETITVSSESPVEVIELKTETKDTVTGMDLSYALSDSNFKSSEKTIILRIKDTLAPEVTMTGFWDGRLLTAAMHAIEKKYGEIRKHATVWAMKQSQEKSKQAV